MSNLVVSEIWIYPVKGLGGIPLQSSKVLPKGLEYDRRWMLVDEGNTCITQRDCPRMARCKLSGDSGKFSIRFSDHTISISANSSDEPILAKIWDDKVEVFEVSREHSEWLSDRLQIKCRLVSFPERNARPVDPEYKINDDHVSLADAYPLLIIGQRSLDDLNARLEVPVPINRFRPNVVFTGGDPYDEDYWRNFSIGRNRFAAVKKCIRCVVTTIDQMTGEKGIEPLRTLSNYRKQEGKVYFGQNLIAIDYERISVGDEITLQE